MASSEYAVQLQSWNCIYHLSRYQETIYKWSLIAGRIPGRTDNEIKNYWNTHLSKKLISQGIDPKTHKPLNPNPSIDNMNDSSSEAVVHNSLSNPYYAPLASENVIINNVQLGEGNMYSHQYADDQNGLKKDLGNSDEGMSHEDAGDDMINCCPDDAFSSFLNSLINDDMFNNQHQDQQEQYQPSS